MKKLIVILVPIIVVAAVTLLVVIFVLPSVAASPVPAASQRTASVESYVSEHIAELSPEKAVLGGHFYVTDIQAGDGKGVVSYEDGHVVFTADFTYEDSVNGIVITSFTIRQ